MVVKHNKLPQYIKTFSITRSKIYPNGDFWSEKKPSGNPGTVQADTGEKNSKPVTSTAMYILHHTRMSL
jgi:hypothetical protein